VKILVALALALVGIAIAVLTYRAEPDTLDQRIKAEQVRETQMKGPPSPSVVLSIKPSTASALPAVAANSNRGVASQEYAKARSFKALYDRLSKPGGAVTGDDKFVLYKVLASCARRTDKGDARPDPAARQQAFEKGRHNLEARISPTDPDRDKRLAMYDALYNRCAGMENAETTATELNKLLTEAAALGDPKAQVRLAFPPSESPGGMQHLTISDTQFRGLQSALASRDPDAIAIAGMAMSNTFDDAILQVGPDHTELQGHASMEAWRLVACEYGMECGSDSMSVMNACVGLGQCAATTVPDLVFYYGVSPYEAQLIDQYRQIFRNAVANNDWSALTLSRQPNTTGSRFYFSSSP
jgi:hypothetical protein